MSDRILSKRHQLQQRIAKLEAERDQLCSELDDMAKEEIKHLLIRLVAAEKVLELSECRMDVDGDCYREAVAAYEATTRLRGS